MMRIELPNDFANGLSIGFFLGVLAAIFFSWIIYVGGLK